MPHLTRLLRRRFTTIQLCQETSAKLQEILIKNSAKKKEEKEEVCLASKYHYHWVLAHACCTMSVSPLNIIDHFQNEAQSSPQSSAARNPMYNVCGNGYGPENFGYFLHGEEVIRDPLISLFFETASRVRALSISSQSFCPVSMLCSHPRKTTLAETSKQANKQTNKQTNTHTHK
jgi:hypothetical protein